MSESAATPTVDGMDGRTGSNKKPGGTKKPPAAPPPERAAKSKSRARARKKYARGKYTASIYSDPEVLPAYFCELVGQIESLIKAPIWLLIQNDPPDDNYSDISAKVYKGFQGSIPSDAAKNTAFLIESPGGDPGYAFRIGRLFQRRTKLAVMVPQYAKSAATLLALAADKLTLGRDAELGPLDLQIFDFHNERYDSALNSVQSLERLGAYALTAVDQTMQLLMRRLPKRSDVLLPLALEYVANLLKPLLEKVDTVDYSRKSRDLKVAEEYAARLMRQGYGLAKGKDIARRLVENYPAHGFVIDTEEAVREEGTFDDPNSAFGLGLKAERAEQDLQLLFDKLIPFLDSITAIGRIEEVDDE